MGVSIEPPPNYDSFRSWLAVGGSFLGLYCTVGYFNAFGVYQEYYRNGLLKDYSQSDISWIGSVAIFLLYIGSPISGILVDRIGPTKLLIIGSVGELVAVFLSSLCSQYYQLFLSQAVLLGASTSLTLTPITAVISRRMPHRRGFALGIAIGGSSIGGIIWPIMLQQLLYVRGVSFGWTQRAVGFTMLPLVLITCVTVVDVNKEPSKPNPSVSDASEGGTADGSDEPTVEEKPRVERTVLGMFKNLAFTLLCLGLALTYLGLFTPFFYISTYAISKGVSPATAFYLISAINAASFFGRTVPGHFADHYGYFNVLTLSVLSAGIIAFTWTAAYNLPGMIVWSIAYGFTSGAVISLQGACAGKISKPEQQGTALGLLLGSISVTALVGTPISGQVLLRGGFLGLGIWTGVTLLTGGLVLMAARLKLSSKILAAY
ncbi:hypothetical protein NPX13_g2035 [Xylaria arbuscula]|uniref:Major facilitator superfamily (MFS) profile domain-containing protein n=1 Tax=Xylaria arbuscula TaxID=114810 RepID=A0A9W8NKS9_9PEZI|nr:hypothetical protein NPX13_g2035 [Xylaria arbuscula]